MDGLTNIITKIQEQNALECKKIISEAEGEAKRVISNAELEAENIALAAEKEIKEKSDVIKSKAESASLLEYKRVVLSEKSVILDEIISDAVKCIVSSDDSVYFEYMINLIKANALHGDGSIRFNDKDLKRLPKGFENMLSKICEDKGKLIVSNIPYDCDGGFVIEYPEMRIDCTLSSLVEDKIEQIRDEISKTLFA